VLSWLVLAILKSVSVIAAHRISIPFCANRSEVTSPLSAPSSVTMTVVVTAYSHLLLLLNH
jgi:hypothetical protein